MRGHTYIKSRIQDVLASNKRVSSDRFQHSDATPYIQFKETVWKAPNYKNFIQKLEICSQSRIQLSKEMPKILSWTWYYFLAHKAWEEEAEYDPRFESDVLLEDSTFYICPLGLQWSQDESGAFCFKPCSIKQDLCLCSTVKLNILESKCIMYFSYTFLFLVRKKEVSIHWYYHEIWPIMRVADHLNATNNPENYKESQRL